MNKEVDIVKKLCEIMGVKYSHYDNHKMAKDYFNYYKLNSTPKIVSYSSTYGSWEFAVLEDMTVITPLSRFYETLIRSIKVSEELGYVSEIKYEVEEGIKRINEAEKYLKDNNCSVIINNNKYKKETKL